MHEWMSDTGFTPHVIVDAGRPAVEVPRAYIKTADRAEPVVERATQHWSMGNEWIEFDARFGGISHHVRVPIAAVLGVYARETGEGMVFPTASPEPPPTQEAGTAGAASASGDGPKPAPERKRPKLEGRQVGPRSRRGRRDVAAFHARGATSRGQEAPPGAR
jgi:stringent starvation protein B